MFYFLRYEPLYFIIMFKYRAKSTLNNTCQIQAGKQVPCWNLNWKIQPIWGPPEGKQSLK